MPLFPKNPPSPTPYAAFRFRVVMDGVPVLGVSRVGGLVRTTEVVRHREGGKPSPVGHIPGQTSYDPITLARGVSYDPRFREWANLVFDWGNAAAPTGLPTSLGDFRRDLTIEVYNEAGQQVLAYRVRHAWVSELDASASLDGDADALVLTSMTLQHEGWERIGGNPVEPAFTLPGGSPPR